MKPLMLAVLTATVLASGTSVSHAQNYPWCLVISDITGSWTCYFTTREQCLESAGGNVGFCTQNPAYQGPSPQPRRPAR